MELYILLKFSTLESNLHINEKLYNDLSEKFKKICFVNISKLRPFGSFRNFQIKEKIFKNNKKFNFLQIENEKQFRKILNKKNIVVINNFSYSFKDFYLHFLVKKYSIFQIIIQNIGFIPGGESHAKKKIFTKIKFFFNKTLPHKLFSLFLILKIFKPIDIRFISNKDLFLKIKNSTRNKLQKKMGYLQINQYKKTFLINSRSHDFFYKNKDIKINDKYITFIESHIDHRDKVRDEGKSSPYDKKNYYKKINILFNKLSKIYKKKIIICVHPKYSISEAKKNFKKFKVVKFKTREYITKSFMVCFHDSSAILDAFYLNKNVLSIQSKHLGKLYAYRNNIYHKHIPIFTINIDNEVKISKSEIKNKLNLAKKKYNQFKEIFLVRDKHQLGSNQIFNIVKREYSS